MVTFKDWLKHKLDAMVVVQRTHLNVGDIDLVILCWSGVRINVHLIQQQIKPRVIKKMLQTATQVGVNTLFLVHAHLLPENGKRTLRETWLLALHSLIGERIYAYQVIDGVPELRQVHFMPINGTQDYTAWYGPKVNFNKIRFYRHSVTSPSVVKGDWLVADFSDHNFWKDHNFQSYHSTVGANAQRRQTTWQTWSQTPWGEKTISYQSPMQAYLDSCYELLGVEISSSYDEVKAAYRKRVMVTHPDTSNLPDDEAHKQFHEIKQAYDYIKAAHGWE